VGQGADLWPRALPTSLSKVAARDKRSLTGATCVRVDQGERLSRVRGALERGPFARQSDGGSASGRQPRGRTLGREAVAEKGSSIIGRVERHANWQAAEVEATEEGFLLTVPIEGDPDPEWDDAFRRAVEARRREVWGGRWGHVRHRPDQIRVEQVVEGSEKPLREFLDACVGEAERRLREEAADRRNDQDALERRRTEASYDHEMTGGSDIAKAERMTDRFRQP
jgi:hypothetical protein